MKNKTKKIIPLFLIFGMVLSISPSLIGSNDQTMNPEPLGSYSTTLLYHGDYVYQQFIAEEGDFIYWEYAGSNVDVGIAVLALDSVEFGNFQIGDPFSPVLLSGGTYYEDSGVFSVPYDDLAGWYIVFWHGDPELVGEFTFLTYDTIFFDDDAYEDNDDNLNAAELFDGDYFDLVSFDADWYSLYLNDGDLVDIDLYFDTLSDDLDLYLYDEDFNLITSSNSAIFTEACTILATYTGYYYIYVENSDVQSLEGLYDLYIDVSEDYAEFLVYSDYTARLGWANGGDYKHWEFTSLNDNVGITVYAMDSTQFTNFQNDDPYSYYELSDGSYISDSGIFAVPYQDTWYTVFINDDADMQDTYLATSVFKEDNAFGGSLLDYYCYTSSDYFGLWKADTLNWEFEGTNYYVGITLYAMDSLEFTNFQNGDPFTFYELSDGTLPQDSGTFLVPYAEDWHLVFSNIDTTYELPTDIVTSVEVLYTGVGDDIYEDNDDLLNAAELFDGDYFDLVSFDADWYSLYLNDGDLVDIDLYFDTLSDDLDLYLYDEDFNLITSSNSAIFTEACTILATYTGYYYIYVENSDVQSLEGLYDLYIDVSEDYAEFLVYSDYTARLGWANGGDYKHWEFTSLNEFIGIRVLIMDSENYEDYVLGNAYGCYELSDGSYITDFGTFVVPYQDTWYTVFINDDADMEDTYLVASVFVEDNAFDGTLLNFNYYVSSQYLDLWKADTLNWEFEGSNYYVGITVHAMDSTEFVNFQNGDPYTYYELSDGTFTQDSGSFLIPYAEDWIIMFINIDPTYELPTDIVYSVEILDTGYGDDVYEDNDDLLNAAELFSGDYFDLVSFDADWYSLYLNDGDLVDIDLYFDTLSDDLDLYLYDEDFNLIEFSASITQTEALTILATYTGYYYIYVENFDVQSLEGLYDLYIDVSEDYAVNLAYSDYNWFSIEISAWDEVDWEFESFNEFIGIRVLIMDSENYEDYVLGNAYGYYELSDGAFISDIGSFEFPYGGIWYVVFLNDDNDMESSYVHCEIALTQNDIDSDYLPYENFVYYHYDDELQIGDSIEWEFTSTNPEIGITVYALLEADYLAFTNSESYSYYELSDGSYIQDSGSFTIPEAGTWYLIFLNNDSLEYPTELISSINLIEIDDDTSSETTDDDTSSETTDDDTSSETTEDPFDESIPGYSFEIISLVAITSILLVISKIKKKAPKYCR